MHPNAADMAIEAVEIAECNLLNSFLGIMPDQVYQQVLPEFNSIGWIFGHCAVHYHWVINLSYQAERVYSEDVCTYFRYGTTKEEILEVSPPISFHNLVDGYLKITESSIKYLRQAGEEVIHDSFSAAPNESLLQSLHRMAFHFMGHMGQIVMIRRALNNPGPSFVDGVTRTQREKILKNWNEWWIQNRYSFHI